MCAMNVYEKSPEFQVSILRRLAMAREKTEGGAFYAPPPARNRVKQHCIYQTPEPGRKEQVKRLLELPL